MLDFLGAIDGTGPVDNIEYEAALNNSHVQRVKKKFSLSTYLRGPDWWDGDGSKDCTKYSIQKMVQVCLVMHNHKSKPRIWLTGYSRGAGAILEVCHRLKAYDASVYGLILFDAVDMTNQFDRGNIPSNVGACVHFTRNQKTSASRESFSPGTIGRKKETGAGPLLVNTFHCTHGGAGGAFFKESDVSSITGTIWEDVNDGYTNVTLAQDNAASATIMAQTSFFISKLRT